MILQVPFLFFAIKKTLPVKGTSAVVLLLLNYFIFDVV